VLQEGGKRPMRVLIRFLDVGVRAVHCLRAVVVNTSLPRCGSEGEIGCL